MARGRMIAKTLGESRKYANLQTEVARVAYVLILANTDKAGRLEADPFYITRKVCTRLPYTTDQVAEALTDMERVGLIIRYESRGVPVLQIVDFDKHNKPHHKEPESEIQAPPDNANSVTDTQTQARSKHDSSTDHAKTQARPVQADKRIKEKEREEKESEPPPDHSEERMARAFDTGQPQANEEHRVRSEIRKLAGQKFAHKHAGDLPSWTRWTNDDLRRAWEHAKPAYWPGERHKQRAWIFADLLNEERSMPTPYVDTAAEAREYARQKIEQAKRERGLMN